MPSTVVHVALAGLVGTALLAEHFDWKAVVVVMAATAFVDLDAFVGLWVVGAHRAAFHTLLLPVLAGALLWWDLRIRNRSSVRRWGDRGVRVAWVTIFAVAVAGIGLDLFFNGVNLFYPVHDRFYDFSGKLLYSNQRGLVQTLIDPTFDFDVLTDEASKSASSGGSATGSTGGSNTDPAPTTKNTHYSTGVDPTKGAEKKQVERIFPIAYTGERALLALTGYMVVGFRVWMERRE